MGRRHKRRVNRAKASARGAMKASSGIGGYWPAWIGTSGLTYDNADLSRSPAGSALAYQTVIAVRRAVDLIGNALNGMDWHIIHNPSYDRANDEIIASSEDVRPRHPLQAAFQHHRREFGLPVLRAIASDYQLYGEVYFQKLRSPLVGGARAIRRMNPLGVTPHEIDGQIVNYSYSWGGQTTVDLLPDEVAYWHSFHPARDGRGLGVPTSAIDLINIKRNLQRFLRAFFVNYARPDLIVSPEAEDSWMPQDQERMVDVLRANHRGTDNAFSTLVVHRAIKALQLDPPDVTAQYSIDESITRQVFMAFGVPLSMAGDSNASSYKDGDEVRYGFYSATIIPFALDVQEYINYQIMPFFDPSGNARFEFDLTAYERITETDLARAQLAETLYRSGIATLNEARQQVKLTPLPDGNTTTPELMPAALLAQAPTLAGSIAQDPTVDLPVGDEPPSDAKAARYDHIDFTPNDGMVEEAKRGLAWRQEFGRGGTAVGVARARDIANRRTLSPETVRRMKAYFDRHQSDESAQGWRPGEDGYPSAGRIAWALWGGDAGYAWSRARVEQMNAADVANRKGERCVCGLDHDRHSIAYDNEAAPSWDKRAALHELKVWARRVKNGKLKPFQPRYLAGYWGLKLQAAQAAGSFFEVYPTVKHFLTVDRPQALEAGFTKSLIATEADFREAWSRAMDSADQGEMTRAEAGRVLRGLLLEYCTLAYIDGMQDGGYVVNGPDDLPDDAKREIERHVEAQSSFVSDLTAHIYLEDDLSEAQLADKARQWWSGSVRPAYEMGLARADSERPTGFVGLLARAQRYRWLLGDAEHCQSCLDLADQVHTLDEYRAHKLLPGSHSLICKQFCKCRLEPTDEPTRGDLSAVRRSG